MKKTISVLMCILMIVCTFSGCTRNVADKEITISFNGQTLNGNYTGSVSKGVPHGEGHFVSTGNERSFDYKGQWEEGKIVGKGKLNDSEYVVHFSDVDRTGVFSGDVIDGIPQGEGTFTAVNDEKVKYTYTGSWSNGLFHGQGVCEYEDDEYYTKSGNFENGDFMPNKLDFIKAIGTSSSMQFTPSENAKNFIKSHENFFPADKNTSISEYVDKSLTYKSLIKNPEKYGDKLISLSNYTVAQVFESEFWGYTVTSFLAFSSYFDDYVYVYYLGELPNVYEGSVVEIQGLPIDSTSFDNIGGGTTLCYMVYGCSVK